MANPIKLTLGQAAKEVGISKPSLSAAIKKGRLSAYKNESGTYEIDPAELFRVYPRKSKSNGLEGSKSLPSSNTKKEGLVDGKNQVLDLLLEEKDNAIKRLENDNAALHQALEKQAELAKGVTRLLEGKSSNNDEWKAHFKQLEERIANKEREAQKEIDEIKKKASDQVKRFKRELQEEKQKSFFQKLFG